AYFKYGVSKKTLAYLGWYAWWRMVAWIRRKHPKLGWRQIRRRYYGADRISEDGVTLHNPAKMQVQRYRFRGPLIGTPFNVEQGDRGGAGFGLTGHDDAAFVGLVSELVSSVST